eukprot:1400232-Rhodomonas_salina.2
MSASAACTHARGRLRTVRGGCPPCTAPAAPPSPSLPPPSALPRDKLHSLRVSLSICALAPSLAAASVSRHSDGVTASRVG